MIKNNLLVYSSSIILEQVRDILMFPVWWYSRGLWHTLRGLGEFLSNRQKGLALKIWISNIFKPMFGQSDWQGILISIFMRLIQIIFRSIAMLFWVIVALAMLVLWVGAPILIVLEIMIQVNGIFFS